MGQKDSITQGSVVKDKKKIPPEAIFAKPVVDSIIKLSRLYKLYSANNEIIKKQMAVFMDSVKKFFEQFDQLDMRITPEEIIFRGNVLYENADRKQSFSFNLFKDGVRGIIIRRGVTKEELVKFLSIIGVGEKSSASRYDDISTLVWKADFKSIQIKAVKGFRELRFNKSDINAKDEPGDPEFSFFKTIFSKLPIEAGGIGGTGTGALPTVPDEASFVRSLIGGEETIDTENGTGEMVDGAEEVGVYRIKGNIELQIDMEANDGKKSSTSSSHEAPMTDENIRKLAVMLEAVEAQEPVEETQSHVYEELLKAERTQDNYRVKVFEVAESLISNLPNSDPDEAKKILFSISKILALALKSKDVPMYFAIIDRVYLLIGEDSDLDVRVKQLTGAVLNSQLENENGRMLISSINPKNPSHVKKLISFYRAFGKSLADTLFDLIATTEEEEEINSIEEILVFLSGGKSNLFAQKLYDRRIKVVKSVLKCLTRLGDEKAKELMVKTIRHPNGDIKLFLLKLLKIRKVSGYQKILIEAINDRDEDVRVEALKQIFSLKDLVFKPHLLNRVTVKDFANYSLQEKIILCKALAAIAGREVEELFVKNLEKKSLFKREEMNEIKIASAEALAIIGGSRSREALIKASGSSNKQLRQLCERLLMGMR